MVWLSESNRSQILQLLFSCSLLVYFLFWYSRIGTLCGQPSILVRQREGIVNFTVKMDAQKAANWRRVMLWHIQSTLAKSAASGSWFGTREQSDVSSPLEDNTKYRIGWTSHSQQPVRTGQLVGPLVFYRSDSINQDFLLFWIKHNAQDRTGLAPREPGVLCFG